jgi:beta-lactam-binding protein with PASTA domain
MFRRRRRVVDAQEAGPPPRRPLLWPWLVLVLLLVGALVAGAYFLTRDDDGGGSENRVPNVVGQTVTDAVRELTQRGYPAEVRSQVSRTEIGRVLSQDPDPGTELDSGERVVLVVGRSLSTVDVPRVVGLQVGDAFERLQAARLRGRQVRVASTKPKDVVVSQRPPAGAQARRGRLVVLSVSRGPRLVSVPLVEGLRQAAAVTRLKRSSLRSRVVNVPSQEPAGTVVAQSPRAGKRVPEGSAVQINVAGAAAGSTDTTPTTGTATIPKVVGTRDTDAVALIKQAGFRVQSTAVSSGQPTGTVLTQSPAGGTVTRRGTTVRLTVSGGPRVRVVPNVVGREEAEANRILRAAGFVARPVDRPVTEPEQVGRVVEQDPAAGTRVQGSTEVLIFIGRQAQ